MALLAAATMAITFAVPAQAAWVSYQKRADADELYDSTFLSNEQGRVKLWTLTSFAQPLTSLEGKEYSSEKTLTIIDCASRKAGAEQVIRYAGKDGKGDMVGDMQTPLRLTGVRPGSTDEALLARICK
ncbi:MAG: hypothetical protein RL404_1660 [Pseudomonadota bacterium]|jgi:hypothetical protein